MAKKRRTELDIDRDFLSQEQEAPPPPKAPEPPPPPPPQPEKRRRKVNKVKLAIVTGASLAAASLTAALVWFAVSFIQSMPSSREEAKPKPAQVPSPKPATVAAMYTLHPFFIPLKEKGSAGGQFARIQFALEMVSPDVQKDVDRNITLVRENVYFMLQGRDRGEFTGREKLDKLAVDVAIAVNRSLQSGGVTRVWITDILIS